MTDWAVQMDYMARALQLASRALGSVNPNPPVGAVLVRDGQVVGEGATQPPGQAHAEIVALRAAGDRARGSALYVTLEPCAHYGRTPPCANAIVAAGVSEVHVAMLDPSPWVNGQGLALLERARLRVTCGAHEGEARRLYEPYLTWLTLGRPLVTAVYALGLDGRPRDLAAADLGSAASAELERLRAGADRTVSAIDTLLADDPTLAGLAAAGITALQVEAPPHALGELVTRGLLDRVQVFLTPTLGAPAAHPGAPAPLLDAPGAMLPAFDCVSALQDLTYERLGDTVLVTGRLPRATAPATAPTGAAEQPAPAP